MSVQSIHAFAEKVALVSDGASPIGRAVCLQLALQGCFVIAVYQETTREIESLLQELNSLGTLAAAVKTDISTSAGVRQAIDEVESRYGRLDLLINCLNNETDSTFEDITADDFDQFVSNNLGSVYFLTQCSLSLMQPRPKPRIVNVIWESRSGDVLFGCLQSSIAVMTQSLAKTLPKNFRVNAVKILLTSKPGSAEFDTELIEPRSGVLPDDVARAILYLLSPEAVAVNGQIVEVG